MTNLDMAEKLIKKGDKSYSTYLKLVNLKSTAKNGNERYQIADMIEAFIVSGGDSLNIDGILSDMDKELENVDPAFKNLNN